MGPDLHLDICEARAVQERVRPHHELAAVGKGVDGQPGTLDPGNDLFSLVFRFQRADVKNHLVAQFLEDRLQVNGRFGQFIGGSTGFHLGREELLAGWHHL